MTWLPITHVNGRTQKEPYRSCYVELSTYKAMLYSSINYVLIAKFMFCLASKELTFITSPRTPQQLSNSAIMSTLASLWLSQRTWATSCTNYYHNKTLLLLPPFQAHDHIIPQTDSYTKTYC